MDNKILFVVVLSRLAPSSFNNLPAFFPRKTFDSDLFHMRSVSMETTPGAAVFVVFLSSAFQIWSACDPHRTFSFFFLFHISAL